MSDKATRAAGRLQAECERLRAYKVRYLDLRERVKATMQHVERLANYSKHVTPQTMRDIASDLRGDLQEPPADD